MGQQTKIVNPCKLSACEGFFFLAAGLATVSPPFALLTSQNYPYKSTIISPPKQFLPDQSRLLLNDLYLPVMHPENFNVHQPTLAQNGDKMMREF